MLCGVEYGTASLAGVEFTVLPVSHSGGNRLVTHVYPFWDKHFNERLGRAPRKWTVRGRIHGERFREKVKLADALWNQAKSLDFYEPTLAQTYKVDLANEWSFQFDDRTLNSVEFTLELVEASTQAAAKLQVIRVWQASDELLQSVDAMLIAAGGSRSDRAAGMAAASGYAAITARIHSPGQAIAWESGVTPQDDIATIGTSMESAFTAGVDPGYFADIAAMRLAGDDLAMTQGDHVAGTALAYYAESLVANPVHMGALDSYSTISRSYMERMTNADVINKLRQLDLAVIGEADIERESTLDGEYHPLTAAYALYGAIDRAYELSNRNGYQGGAMLSGLRYVA